MSKVCEWVLCVPVDGSMWTAEEEELLEEEEEEEEDGGQGEGEEVGGGQEANMDESKGDSILEQAEAQVQAEAEVPTKWVEKWVLRAGPCVICLERRIVLKKQPLSLHNQ